MSVEPDTAVRRRPAAALLAGILWLTAVAALVVVTLRVLAAPELDALALAQLVAALVLQVAAPLAVVLVALELVRLGGRNDARRLAELETRRLAAAAATTAIRDGLLDIDATLTAITGRIETLRAIASGDGTGLVDAAVRIEQTVAGLTAAAANAGASAQTLLGVLPEAQRQADAVRAVLAATGSETARQVGEIETMLAGVWARNVDAGEQVAVAGATMAGLLAGIEAASVRAGTAIAAHATTLGASVDTALDRTAAALDATRTGVGQQTAGLIAGVEQARTALDRLGAEASRGIAERLERVLGAASAFTARLAEQDEQSRATIQTIERSFAVLDARLGHAASMSHATLDGIAVRMTAVRGEVDTIGAPLAATNASLHEAEAATRRLAAEAAAVATGLASTLPDHRRALAELSSDVAALADEADGLGQPLGAGRDVAAELSGQLAAAQTGLAALDERMQGSALSAANQLIEVLSRVREVANATAGTMRETLAGIVAEAEAALADAGGRRVEAAFGAPIRAELAGLELASDRAGAAAQATAARIADRLLGLTRTVALVEARIDDAGGRFDARLRDDIVARSSVVLDLLQAQAIDLSKPFARDIGTAEWAAYLRGDRGLFARKAVRLLDRGTAAAVARLARDDPAFAEQAARYVDAFETLLRHVAPDVRGSALAVALISSDIGKLFVALAQALGRGD